MQNQKSLVVYYCACIANVSLGDGGRGEAIWTTTSSGILVIMNESVNTDGTLNCNLKGDAAFWWNLKRSGDGDVSTRHAGCPVLVGSKWGE